MATQRDGTSHLRVDGVGLGARELGRHRQEGAQTTVQGLDTAQALIDERPRGEVVRGVSHASGHGGHGEVEGVRDAQLGAPLGGYYSEWEMLADFARVIEVYPQSSKVPDALLKMGYCNYSLQRWDDARAALSRVQSDYPTTTAARLAALTPGR